MAYSTYQTYSVGGVTIIVERGDQRADFGYRVRTPNTTGTAVPLNRLATVTDGISGYIYAFASEEFRLHTQPPSHTDIPSVAFRMILGTLVP